MSYNLESERPLKKNSEPWIRRSLPCLRECMRRTKQEKSKCQVPFDVTCSVIVNCGEVLMMGTGMESRVTD